MSTEAKNNILHVLQNTPAAQIADLAPVRDRYIQNYNACHKEKVGDLMYHRNVIHFKQAIAASEQLAKCDPFSLYACFATAAVNGYSMDPADNEVYLIARGGKACLDRQAGAYVKRLMRTGQVYYFDQAKLVYQGDTFQVENGRVLKHVETFTSDIIVAGYVRVVIGENGEDRFFIYRKSDFESWRKKSPQANGPLWTGNGGQPDPNFLRTKIVKHAGKEKCWASGSTPAQVDVFEDTEIDSDDLPPVIHEQQPIASIPATATHAPQQQATPQPEQLSPHHFAPEPTPAPAMVVAEDEEGLF